MSGPSLQEIPKELSPEIKDNEIYITPTGAYDEKMEEKAKEDYKVFIKKLNNRWKISGGDKESRIKAILTIFSSNKEEAIVADEIHSDSENDEVLEKMAKKILPKKAPKRAEVSQQEQQPISLPKSPVTEPASQSVETTQAPTPHPNYIDSTHQRGGYNRRGENSYRGRGNRYIHPNTRTEEPSGSEERNQEPQQERGPRPYRGSKDVHRGRPYQPSRPQYGAVQAAGSMPAQESVQHTQAPIQHTQAPAHYGQAPTHYAQAPASSPAVQAKQRNQFVWTPESEPAKPEPEQKKVKLDSHIMHVLCLMNSNISMSTSESTILSMTNLGIEYLSLPQTISHPNEPTFRLNIPHLLADLLSESLAIDLPENLICSTNKFSNRGPLNLTLEVPARIPVWFNSLDNAVQLGFYDTSVMKANIAREQISSILNTFAKRKLLVVKLNKIDRQSIPSSQALRKIASLTDCVILKSISGEDEEMGASDVELKILEYNWDSKKEGAVKVQLESILNTAALRNCRYCHCVYKNGDGSKCEEHYHSGRQIPVEGRKMEVSEVDDEGNPITIQKFECCGEVIKEDDIGCATRMHANHEEESTFSSSEYTTEPVYKP